jgi:hypothetical protein
MGGDWKPVEILRHASCSIGSGDAVTLPESWNSSRSISFHSRYQRRSRSWRTSYYSNVGELAAARGLPVSAHAVTMSESTIGLRASAVVDVRMGSGFRLKSPGTSHDEHLDATTTCPAPGCRRETAFAIQESYRIHLRSTHKLHPEEMDKYRIPSTYRGPAFGIRRYPHQDCDDSDIQRSRRDLEAHLRSRPEGVHCLTGEEATKMVDGMIK